VGFTTSAQLVTLLGERSGDGGAIGKLQPEFFRHRRDGRVADGCKRSLAVTANGQGAAYGCCAKQFGQMNLAQRMLVAGMVRAAGGTARDIAAARSDVRYLWPVVA